METSVPPLAHIDSFAYRHRLGEVMSRPVLSAPPAMTVGQAAERMDAGGKSAIVVVDGDGRAAGVFTERDVLRLVAGHRADAAETPLAEVMSAPVHTVSADAFLFVALGRMSRLGLRHLVVVDAGGRPVGVVTARQLQKIRITEALVIGDDIGTAASAADMARARRHLPRVAGELLAEGVSARDVAAVISQVLRDMTARAAELARRDMEIDGWGEAPARWCLLVLGSGGRGESLLSFDQDNALIHDGDESDDLWFAELARRLNDLLDEAGIPYCHGEVMARNPLWRRSVAGWKDEVWRWVHKLDEQTLLNCDIFFDFVPVHGDPALAEDLRAFATDTAADSPFFLQFLAMNVGKMEVPIGLFGGFVTTRRRLDAKKSGLLPLVSAARVKAVRARLHLTGTFARYQALRAAGNIHPEEFRAVAEAHEVILRAMLDQQLVDIAAGKPPSSHIEPRRFDRGFQARLKEAFLRVRLLNSMIGSLGPV